MGRIDAMARALTAGSGIGAISRAAVHEDTAAMRTALSGLLSRAETSVHADVFRLTDDAVVDGLESLRGRDVALHVLADTESATGPNAARVRSASTTFHAFGDDPLKQHGKAVTRDGGAEAMVATDLADVGASRRRELAVTFGGDPARALARVHANAGVGGAPLVDALDAAAAHGVAINDPAAGVSHASAAVDLLVASPSSELTVMTKLFDSKRLSKWLATRAETSKVTLVTHDVPESQLERMREAGVDVRLIKERGARKRGLELHGTTIHTDDRTLVGSLFLDDRVLVGSNGRQSREVAAVLDGDAARSARERIEAAIDQLAVVTR